MGAAGEPAVESGEVAHHGFDRKKFANQCLAAGPEVPAEGGIRGEAEDDFDERGSIAGVDEKTGFTRAADLAGTVTVVGYDRPAGGQGLRQGTGKSFAPRQVDEQIHEGQVGRDGFRRDEPGKDDSLMDAEPAGLGFESCSPEAVANQEESELRATPE